jgi:hypothetical protein
MLCFFHVRDAFGLIHDEEGTEFSNIAAAITQRG